MRFDDRSSVTVWQKTMPRLRTVEAIPLSYAMFGILDLYSKLRLRPEYVHKKSLSP